MPTGGKYRLIPRLLRCITIVRVWQGYSGTGEKGGVVVFDSQVLGILPWIRLNGPPIRQKYLHMGGQHLGSLGMVSLAVIIIPLNLHPVYH